VGQSESDAGPLSDDEGGAGEDDLSEDEDQAETPAEKRLRIGAPSLLHGSLRGCRCLLRALPSACGRC